MSSVYSIAKCLFLSLLLILTACDPGRIYEKNLPVDAGGWLYSDYLDFEVNIPDTVSAYNIYLNVRHSDLYAYSNLWVQLQTMLPDSSVMNDKVQVELALTDGQWTGNCIDGICMNSVLIRSNVVFPKPGTYRFRIIQDMRQDPLPEILNAGLKLERL
jgi:gliding motility-associated lipoprotein GldH